MKVEVEAARKVAGRYEEDWRKKLAKRDRDVATASRDKTMLGDHYWQEEYLARVRHQTAQVVAQIFEEEFRDGPQQDH